MVAFVDSYEPGLWNRMKAGSTFTTNYLHNDHLGTLRRPTIANGTAGSSRVFSAFGERIGSNPFDQYGYVGAWGYQAHPEEPGLPFLHVGHRYYDPASGRFLQRDPAGIRGGRNVFVYGENIPTATADPLGLSVGLLPGPQKKRWDPMDRQHPAGPEAARRERLVKENESVQAEARRGHIRVALTPGISDERTRRRVQYVLKVPATITIWALTPVGWAKGTMYFLRGGTCLGWYEEGQELFGG